MARSIKRKGLVKRRVANPSPAVLALVNPKGRKKMATRKRRHSTSRRRTAAKNPAKRRTATKRRRVSAVHRSRAANPVKRVGRRRSVRRRNPPVVSASGTVAEGLKLGVSGIVIGFSQKFVRPLVGNFLPSGPIANAGVTLGTAYGLGWLAGFTKFTSPYKRYLELAGWTIAATQLVTAYVLPALGNFTSGAAAGMSGPRRQYRPGMRGIAAVTGIPPTIVPPPLPPPQAAANGMNGFATVPGRFSR